MIEVDARGLFCPEPLMMAKAAVDKHPGDPIRVLVDTAAARDNISRMLRKAKREFTVAEDGNDIIIDVK